ncbi:MAG TPA: class I SAM-dependent methyltransferase [Gaiellaceae bacterium]|nr:class I SAM-dependent methyltransferase [Gaiellaceae bacterium]
MTTTDPQANTSGGRSPAPPTCGACGGDTRADVASPASTYASRGAYGVATCERCGSGRTVPVPEPSELDAFYSKEYKYDAHLLISAEKRWRARHILDTALPAGAERVLDIGCMYGYLLEEARERGVRDAKGVELSAGPAKAAVASGLDVFCGTIEDFAKKDPGTFDLIVAQHVLEHVPDPVAFLKSSRELLAPGGKVCIAVPNYDARARKVFREAWGWYQVPVHLHHFGERGLASLLEDAGFAVDRTVRRGGDSLFVLMTLLQSLGKMPSSTDAKAPSAVGRALVRTASALLRPYYFVGDDELLVVASPR